MTAGQPDGHGRPGQLSAAAHRVAHRVRDRLSVFKGVLGIKGWHIKITDTTTVNRNGQITVEWATFHLYIESAVWSETIHENLLIELTPFVQEEFTSSKLAIYHLDP